MIRAVWDGKNLVLEGHAKFDEYGKDIVCAAVSFTSQYVAYLLERLGAEFEKEKGRLVVRNIGSDDFSKMVVELFIESLRVIERKYPKSLKVEVI